ncbi:MAG: IS5 family transposase [Candidatus Competibacteraceae bacterium]|nr:IS5 family transposase [Candidatus Competibacteraceae bacterium]
MLNLNNWVGCRQGNHFGEDVMAYHEISDDFWNQVEPLLEPFKRKKSGGSPPLDFRCILNGIFYLLKTGCQWGYLPSCYGSKSAVHAHFQRWVHAGVFTEIFRLSVEKYQALNGIEWEWQAMDGTLAPAPVRGQSLCLTEEGLGRNPTDRGRSGSKIHCHVDQTGIPLGVVLVGANVHDSRLVSPTVAADLLLRPAPTPDQPQHLCLDKGYDYARVEVEVNDHGYIPHIRRIGEEKMADGEKTQPARRWVVERTIAWMKGFRAIRTRYFCKAQNYLAMIHLACALIVFRKLETV